MAIKKPIPNEPWAGLRESIEAITLRISNHEVLCTERWTQLRDETRELNRNVALLIESRSEQAGAMKLARITWVAAGAVIASGAWIIQLLPWRLK